MSNITELKRPKLQENEEKIDLKKRLKEIIKEDGDPRSNIEKIAESVFGQVAISWDESENDALYKADFSESGMRLKLVEKFKWRGGTFNIKFRSLLPDLAIKVDLFNNLLVFYEIFDEEMRRREEVNGAVAQRIRMLLHNLGNKLTIALGIVELLQFNKEQSTVPAKEDDECGLDENAVSLILLDVREINGRIMSLLADPVAERISLSRQEVLVNDLFQYIKGRLPLTKCKWGGDLDGKTVKIDLVYFAQVIENLVNNAEKYSHGNVEVKFYNGKEDELVVKVVDDGIGLPENIDSLFENGIRGNNTNIQGYGLGLHFCRVFIQNMGGKINAFNNSDLYRGAKGATFEIIFETKNYQ